MKLNLQNGQEPNALPHRRAFTLPEMMVAIGVGALLLAAMMAIFITSARSFTALGNYANMNANSRNALDHMTREIRRAGRTLSECTSTTTEAQLKFLKFGTTDTYVVYHWDTDSRHLTEWTTGTT